MRIRAGELKNRWDRMVLERQWCTKILISCHTCTSGLVGYNNQESYVKLLNTISQNENSNYYDILLHSHKKN